MWSLLRRRLVDAALVVWLVASLSFLLLRAAPGDPVTALLTDPRLTAEARRSLERQYGLDQPIATQYASLLRGALRGDLGYSVSRQRPVRDVLRDTLPYTLLLTTTALVLGAIAGALMGAWLALIAPSTWRGVGVASISAVGAVPEPWLATMVLTLFGVQLGWFPLSGPCDLAQCDALTGLAAFADRLRHLAMPVATLSLLVAAPIARLLRSALDEVLRERQVQTAFAKGASRWRIVRRHALRRALHPTVTAIGLSLPVLAGGAVFVERIFGWPGMGSVMIDAVATRDYGLVTAIAAAGSLLVVLGGSCAEMVARWLDPRLRTLQPL
jgi:peptide/nickel transport system permease protein